MVNKMAAVVGAPFSFRDVREGMRGRVKAVHDRDGSLKRLQEMGLTPGAEFDVVKVAPFGDPIEICVRGYRLCLRRREAAGIEIEPVG